MRTIIRLVQTVVHALALGGAIFAAEPRYGTVHTETFARSGPGESFDETSRLCIGDRLEIYEETEDGWCAIRPPLGSFSWVAAAHVELAPNGVGTVLTDGLASRIGSDLHERCRHIAVKLAKGEAVRVLDRRETPENPTSPLWYKITPPRGEFRWVPRSAIVYEAASQTGSVVRTGAAVQDGSTSRTTASQQERTSLTARRLPSPELGAYVEHSVVQVAHEADTSPTAPAVESTQLLTPEEVFEKTYQELRQEARYVMARPTEDWVFEMLVERCDSLYKIAPGDAEREKVLKLGEIIRKTKTIRQEISSTRQRKGLVTPRTDMIRTVAYNPTASEETTLGSVGAAARPLSSLNTPVPSGDYQVGYVNNSVAAPSSAGLSPAGNSVPNVSATSNNSGPPSNSGLSVPASTPATPTAQVPPVQPDWTPHTTISSDSLQVVNTNYAANIANSSNPVMSGMSTPSASSVRSVKSTNVAVLPLPTNETAARANSPSLAEDRVFGEAISESALPRRSVPNEVVGRLGRFNPLPPGYPPYALADEEGQVLCLLSPEPGVDMADLVGKWVGVDGERSFYVEEGTSEKRHILVRNVRVLNGN